MREIKFRVWDKEQKVMLYPRKDVDGDTWCITGEYGDISFPLEIPQGYVFKGTQRDYIPMQYTGLWDKNGKEIYGGDIAKVLDRDWPSQLNDFPEMNHQQYLDYISSICVIIYDKDRFILTQIKGKGFFNNCLWVSCGRDVFQVIGNVHENPELLEVE